MAIVPRNVPPMPALRPFMATSIAEADGLQRELTARLEEISRDPDRVFAPSDPASYIPVLETCASRLDASGAVLEPEEELGPATEVLRISPCLCVMVRTRRADLIRDDIERLISRIAEPGELPEPARRFVVEPPDKVEVGPGNVLPGPGTGGGDGGWDGPASSPKPASAREWLLLALPANDEHGDGAACPGGGAYRGGTSRNSREAPTAAARPGDRGDTQRPGGARQLEEAVSALADRVQTIDVNEVRRRAQDHLAAIVREDAEIQGIDADLQAIARANLSPGPGVAGRCCRRKWRRGVPSSRTGMRGSPIKSTW